MRGFTGPLADWIERRDAEGSWDIRIALVLPDVLRDEVWPLTGALIDALVPILGEKKSGDSISTTAGADDLTMTFGDSVVHIYVVCGEEYVL